MLKFVRSVAPGEVKSIPTHDLLQKLGYIHQHSSGLVHWLPLGLRTLRSVESIVRNRILQAGGLEVSLSTLSSKSMWEKTGRLQNKELFKLKDAKDKEYVLAPTCEEEITQLISSYASSYKDLPLLAFQISRKYRDELRPRGGLLRSREFLMKDAYSFDISETEAMRTFDKVNTAYRAIFTDLKVPFKSAMADSGDIGGDVSLEWHYLHPSGSDTLMECNHCNDVSNLEKTKSFPLDEESHAKEAKISYFTNTSRDNLIVAHYPCDREFNPKFLQQEIPDVDLSLKEDQVLSMFAKDDESFLTKTMIRVFDPRVSSVTNLPDLKVSFHRGNMSTLMDIPLVSATEGELCGKCEEGTLQSRKAIEVGHTFYLDEKYSLALNAKFTDRDGTTKTFKMGCYGIGISRLVAAIAEVTRDELGLNWPPHLAPFHVSLIESPTFQGSPDDVAEMCQSLSQEKVSFDRDTRDLSMGKKLKQSQMLGIPFKIIMGKQFPLVELETRLGEKHLVHVTEIAQKIKQMLN